MTAARHGGAPEDAALWERSPAVSIARAEIAERLGHLRDIRENPSPRKQPASRRYYGRRWRKPWADGTDIPGPPDYSSLRRYVATPKELAAAGTPSVEDLVAEVNRLAGEAGSWPVSQGDFPRNKKTFIRLVERRDWLRAKAG